MSKRKKDINNYINSNDLTMYLSGIAFGENFIYRESEITKVEDLFLGLCDFAVILINDLDPSGIGHYVVLRNDDNEGKYTYFDCLGDPITDRLKAAMNEDKKYTIVELNTPLMSDKGIICGKYCIAFVLASDIPLETFYDILTTNRKYTPDQIISKMYRIDYSENILQNK